MKTIDQILILVFGLLFVVGSVTAQDPLTFDYSKVDEHALSVKIKESTKVLELSKKLTAPFDTDIEKARSIFRWVAENIAYDIKGLKSGSYKGYSFSYSSEEEHQRLLREKDIKVAEETIKKGSSICEGYAILFKVLCDEAGLESVTIDGYARNYNDKLKVDQSYPQNHKWNAIKLNEKWYLLDVTWASGYIDFKNSKFTKDYNNRYYLTPPQLFVLNHFPKDKSWQLMLNEVSKEIFNKYPFITRAFHKKKVIDFSPRKILTKIKKEKPVEFGIKTNKNVSGITVSEGNNKYADSTNFIKKGNEYLFKYYFQKKGTYRFSIFLDYQETLVYKVVVK